MSSKQDTLAGQHAFITGGGSGIGLGAARALLADGAKVTLCGRTVDKLDAGKAELVNDLGADVEACVSTVAGDVADEASLGAAVDAANDWAPLTMAIANAGVGGVAPFLTTELADWQQVIQTNLTGVFLTFKLAGGHLVANGGGAMCAVSSIAGSKTHRMMSAYTTSKAGVEMLVRNAADELGALGVRVNAIAPGLVETEISEALQTNDEVNDDYWRNMPLGRRGSTADTGSAIRFLSGPESSWITGVVLPVDGGHHLRRGPTIDPLLAPFFPNLPPVSAGSATTAQAAPTTQAAAASATPPNSENSGAQA